MSQTYEKEHQREQLQVQNQVQDQAQDQQALEQMRAAQQADQKLEDTIQAELRVEYREELDRNFQMMGYAKDHINCVAIPLQIAYGTPEQDELPKPEGFKARRREQKHDKLAKKACPVGTALTYDMVEGVRTVVENKQRSADEYSASARDGARVTRNLKAFAKGYSRGRLGFLSSRDKANRSADHKFFADYLSGDVQRRKPHLDRMVDELLEFPIGMNMLWLRYARKYIALYKDIIDKAYSMNDIMLDPVNASYFQNMDPYKREQLELRLNMYAQLALAVSAITFSHGCDWNHGTYLSQDRLFAIRDGKRSLPAARRNCLGAIAACKQGTRDLEQRYMADLHKNSQDYGNRVNQSQKLLEETAQAAGITLTDELRKAPWLTKGAILLRPERAHQEENVRILRLLFQVRQTAAVPEKQHYQAVKELAAPRVQRILDCDVDALTALTDNGLMLQAPLLNQLALDGDWLEQVMGLTHYTATQKQQSPITLKDDLLRFQLPEYTYKLAMIRALAHRVRATTIGYLSRHGGADPRCFTPEDTGYDVHVSIWADEHMALAQQQLAESRPLLQKFYTIGQPECLEMLERRKLVDLAMSNLMDDPLSQVVQPIETSQEPQDLAIRQRLQENPYYSLDYTPQELKEKGMKPQMTEALFRRFGAFLRSRGAQALLSPEAFRQMLEDLSAGAGLHRQAPKGQDPNEAALAEASAKNARGMAQFNRVLRAHFDYLERKYGDHLTELTVEDLLHHQEELLDDFAAIQVAGSLVDDYPDFIDQNDPELMALKRRVEYYNLVGKATVDLFLPLRTSNTPEEAAAQVRQGQAELKNNPVFRQCAAQMEANHPGYRHAVDWNQDVRDPDGATD